MSPVLQLILELSILIAVAKLAGYLSSRLGQPAVLGEILAGLILGPSLIDLQALPFLQAAHLLDLVHTGVGRLIANHRYEETVREASSTDAGSTGWRRSETGAGVAWDGGLPNGPAGGASQVGRLWFLPNHEVA